jgi:Ca2+-binding RTX toxin-like protein
MNTGDANLFTLATGARTYTIGATTITDSSGTLNTSFTQVERIAFSTVGNGDFDDVIDASAFVSAHGSALDIRLGNGDNLVTGSSSNDRLFTGFGSNIADGGDGYDFAQVNADASSAVTVTITNVGGVLTTNTNGTINQLTGFEEVWVNGVGSGAVTLDASGYVSTPDMALYLIGHNGTDIMIGSAGNDFFANTTGQVLGNDVYTGNGGADIYDYTYAADSMNGDTITDFDIDDVIDFRFNNLEQGGSPVVANHFIGDAAFTGTAGEYRYQINGTQTIVQVDSNGDTVVDQTLTISNGGFMLAETAPGSNILTLAAVINPLDGVVADGYVAGATLFVDVNGNGVRDGGEAWTTTDASGNFTLNVNQAGTIVAIGGVNADTGLANTMTLMAPSDSGVVNPLTTLVEAVIQASGGATTADQAAAQVLAAFGLDPSLDLLNLDLLGQGSDPAALEAQKAAAMVANLVSAAEGAAGAGANTESALVGALADLVTDAAPGTTVDLTDAATLTPLLTEALPGVTNVTTIANEVAAESETIAAATSIDGISDAQLDAALIDYSLNNTITGDAGDNHLFGFGGNDKLSGLGGNDILEGGSGFDFLWGGAGNDKFVAENSASKEQTKVGAVSMDVIFDFAAGDKIDLRQIDANAALAGQQVFNFKGTNAIKVAGDLNYKVYDTVMGAEKALGHDIDGISGASTYSGPVTIVYGNVDSGGADFAIALIGVNGVKASDFIFA